MTQRRFETESGYSVSVFRSRLPPVVRRRRHFAPRSSLERIPEEFGGEGDFATESDAYQEFPEIPAWELTPPT
jgi:hypothetical protein